eukprot:64609-Chlamydomonas_euryale.AAC.2
MEAEARTQACAHISTLDGAIKAKHANNDATPGAKHAHSANPRAEHANSDATMRAEHANSDSTIRAKHPHSDSATRTKHDAYLLAPFSPPPGPSQPTPAQLGHDPDLAPSTVLSTALPTHGRPGRAPDLAALPVRSAPLLHPHLVDEVSALGRHLLLVVWPRDAPVEDVLKNLLGRVGTKRRHADDQLIQDDAERPPVHLGACAVAVKKVKWWRSGGKKGKMANNPQLEEEKWGTIDDSKRKQGRSHRMRPGAHQTASRPARASKNSRDTRI